METGNSTCWTLIDGAVAGGAAARARFAQRYEPAVRAYLIARWRQLDRRGELDDAVQDVFLECFRPDGALDRLDGRHPGGFRAFLYGIVRNVALRIEAKRARDDIRRAGGESHIGQLNADETQLSQVFDRAWAQAVMREAAELQAGRANEMGEAAVRRVELLRLRFHDGLPIRDIAERWQADPVHVHREYSKARQEFRHSLLEVMRFYHPDSGAEAEREATSLLGLLSK